jgi:hypothetical protein
VLANTPPLPLLLLLLLLHTCRAAAEKVTLAKCCSPAKQRQALEASKPPANITPGGSSSAATAKDPECKLAAQSAAAEPA